VGQEFRYGAAIAAGRRRTRGPLGPRVPSSAASTRRTCLRRSSDRRGWTSGATNSSPTRCCWPAPRSRTVVACLRSCSAIAPGRGPSSDPSGTVTSIGCWNASSGSPNRVGRSHPCPLAIPRRSQTVQEPDDAKSRRPAPSRHIVPQEAGGPALLTIIHLGTPPIFNRALASLPHGLWGYCGAQGPQLSGCPPAHRLGGRRWGSVLNDFWQSDSG
jgi:hypothetical protein